MLNKILNSGNMTPLLFRLFHDFFLSALTLILLLYSSESIQVYPTLAFSPLFISLIYFVISLSGVNRSPRFYIQILILTAVVTTSFVINYFFGVLFSLNLPFHLLSLLFLIGPRFYLSLNRREKTFFSNVAHNNKGSILIVGGAGYIGTHLVEILLKQNYSVRVLDRMMYNQKTIEPFLQNPRFEFIEGDATDISKLVRAVTDCTAVVHLAGLVGDPACALDPQFTRHENIISTRMVKEAAKSAGASRFIFASSCSVYGANDEIVSEVSPLNPVSLYANTKIDSEKELLLANNSNFHVTILRFATVFGHSLRPRFDLVGNLFAAQAYNNGKLTVIGPNQWRPFVHCYDLARAIDLVLKSPAEKIHGEIFNVGDDRLNMTIGALAEKIAKVGKEKFNLKVELEIDDNVTDRRNYRVSFKKIFENLGFQCEQTIESGTEEVFKNFKNKLYIDYKSKEYSNVETTKQQVSLFYDPIQTVGLYRPMSDTQPLTK